ncbi:MAG TPA: hypothetical protein VMS76_02495 [Planctomycetota bacterium]|nr:hypothetical protein [Planctomycetota bacterium]
MSGDGGLWAAIDEALDARADPLADPRVRDLLQRRPEELERWMRLRGRLARLDRSPGRRRSRARPAVLAVAAVALVAACVAALAHRPRPSGALVAAVAGPDAAALRPAVQVLSFRTSVSTEGPQGRRETRLEDGWLTTTSEVRGTADGTGGGRSLVSGTQSRRLP